MEKFKIDIANDFSPLLGGRWKRLGPHSGEEFYESMLLPMFKKALDSNEKLHVYLDGTKGYGSSFLDQSFGVLAREFGITNVKNKIEFHSQFYDWIVNYIYTEIWVENV